MTLSWKILTERRPVLRIVYAGPAASGKRTSIGRIAEVLEGTSTAEGLTVEFNDQTFQVVRASGTTSVPESLRQSLLHADAVIFVGDSRSFRLQSNILMWLCLADADPDLERKVIVQLNRCDLPETLTAEEFRFGLRLPEEIPIIETIAVDRTRDEVLMAFTEATALALSIAKTTA